MPAKSKARAVATNRSNNAGDRSNRAAMIREARHLVEEGGVEALKVRVIADALRLSPTAPYAHFPGRGDQLLAEVAAEGFHELNAAMRETQNRDAVRWLRALVAAYVRFGVENPNLYRAMFHARLADHLEGISEHATRLDAIGKTFSELRAIKQQAFDLVCAPLRELAEHERLRSDDSFEAGLAVAALAHGLVGEFIDEGLGKRASAGEAWSQARAGMTSVVTDALLGGLLMENASARR